MKLLSNKAYRDEYNYMCVVEVQHKLISEKEVTRMKPRSSCYIRERGILPDVPVKNHLANREGLIILEEPNIIHLIESVTIRKVKKEQDITVNGFT